MKVLVVYDSASGNTEKIAQALGKALEVKHKVEVVRTGAVNARQVREPDLLIAGSPTYGGRPTPEMLKFLNGIAEGSLKGKAVAAFDTRLTTPLVKLFGYAAGKIGDHLQSKGGNLVSKAEGYFVKGGKGPLKEGEIERAADWAAAVAAAVAARQKTPVMNK